MNDGFSSPLITADEVERAFPLSIAMETQREVFSAFARGEAVMGNRGVITKGNDAAFAYVARASLDGPTIVKFGSVTNGNSARNLPVVNAYIAILDPVTGEISSFIDGESVTRIRTTAASMVAAQELTQDSKIITVIGAGIQGLAHARAALELFNPIELRLVSRKVSAHAQTLIEKFPQVKNLSVVNDAIKDADLIFLCTNSVEPVIASTLRQGTTVISIGSFSPNRSEVASEIVCQANQIYGDDSQTIQSQSGSIINAIHLDSKIGERIISLGSLLNKSAQGRKSANEIVMYFSVGLGIQDAAIVDHLIKSKKK